MRLREYVPGQPTLQALKALPPGHALPIDGKRDLFSDARRSETRNALLDVAAYCQWLVELDERRTQLPAEIIQALHDTGALRHGGWFEAAAGEWAERCVAFFESHGVRVKAMMVGDRPFFLFPPGDESAFNRLALRAEEEAEAYVVFDPMFVTVLAPRRGAAAPRPPTLFLGAQDVIEELGRTSVDIGHELDHLRRFARLRRGEEDSLFGAMGQNADEGVEGGLPGNHPYYLDEQGLDEPHAYLESIRRLIDEKLEAPADSCVSTSKGLASGEDALRWALAHSFALANRQQEAAHLALKAQSGWPMVFGHHQPERDVRPVMSEEGHPEARLNVPWGLKTFRLNVPLLRSIGPDDPDTGLYLQNQLRGLLKRSSELANVAVLIQKVLKQNASLPWTLQEMALKALRSVVESMVGQERPDAQRGPDHPWSYERLVAAYNRAVLNGIAKATGARTGARRPGILTQIAARILSRQDEDNPRGGAGAG